MNKAEFAQELAKKTNISKHKALAITNAALELLAETMTKKEEIRFTGFGVFEAKYTPQRMARNPQTGEDAVIPARYKPIFRPGETLRCRVNND